MTNKLLIYIVLIVILHEVSFCENSLVIPPIITGTVFNLEIQNGVSQFYNGINTPTYGINGPLLAPTLIVNKGDKITLNVTNNLKGTGNSTTIHWHGLHVPANDDGGPHQVIEQGQTWSPKFQILNNAGTFWYHPHGHNKTDLHVSKGLAGMIIVKDSIEAKLNMPRTYGIDDFPIIVQTKSFDILNQIAISTELDTAVFVNGTVHTYLNAPAQIIRFRLLNGSSMRSYNFGFTNNQSYKLIATDAGLIDSAISLTRLRLSPGERAEILLDLQGMNGKTISLKSFSSEFTNNIYGATKVQGMMGGTIPDYNLNHLNGADFEILKINIGNATTNPKPVTDLPLNLTKNIIWNNPKITRKINFQVEKMMDAASQVIGPFNINGESFDMDKINIVSELNSTEVWRITNNTGIAHPFHIHNMHFYILNVNGGTVPNYERGKKDVVLVMPMQYVEFITKFEDFSNDSIPYMYHCHLLHHEDDGMMGSFIVKNSFSSVENFVNKSSLLFPNPSVSNFTLDLNKKYEEVEINIINVLGKTIISQKYFGTQIININVSNLALGLYSVQIISNGLVSYQKLVKN